VLALELVIIRLTNTLLAVYELGLSMRSMVLRKAGIVKNVNVDLGMMLEW
jgi:hypothetical protein